MRCYVFLSDESLLTSLQYIEWQLQQSAWFLDGKTSIYFQTLLMNFSQTCISTSPMYPPPVILFSA